MNKDTLKVLGKLFPKNGEYSYESNKEYENFLKDVLYYASELYTDECWYREYPSLEEFLYTSQVDTIAYDVYEGEYL